MLWPGYQITLTPAEQSMIVLWLAISIIALLCGISVEQQITASLRKQERCLRIIYKDYESPYETLLETTNTTSIVVSRLRLILLEVYKSLHQLNAKCINGLFEVKSTRYSLRNPVKVLQPKKKTTTYHVWHSTQPGSLHTALQRKYTQPCSLFSRGTAVRTMRARLCEQWGTAVCKCPAV